MFNFKVRSSTPHTPGSGCGILFGVGWTLFSSVFLVFGVLMFLESMEKQGWEKTSCQLTRFEIVTNPGKEKNKSPFLAEVSYQYTWEGQSYTGTQLSAQGGDASDDYEELSGLKYELERETQTHCYVNQANPAESALRTSQNIMELIGPILFMLMGLVFTVIGIFLLKSSFAQRSSDKKGSAAPMTDMKGSKGAGIMVPFFGIFAIAGLAMFYFFAVKPWAKYFSAQSWKEVTAEVIWSHVRSSKGSKNSTTYRPDIFYSYEYEGVQHRSNTYSFFVGSSSGYDGKKEIVSAYTPQKPTVCYVNPDKPWQAILNRSLGWWALLSLFPLPFMLVGLGGLFWIFKGWLAPGAGKAGTLRSTTASGLPSQEALSAPIDLTARTLSPGKNRIYGFLGGLFIALFWNGIVSVFVVVAVKSWGGRNPEWFLSLFMIPFVCIGLFLIFWTGKLFLQIFAPRPVLTLDPGEIALGTPTSLQWRIMGRTGSIQDMRIYLVGEEEAQFRRGTNTVKEQQIFHEELLMEGHTLADVVEGNCRFTLPMKTSPSWAGTSNAVKWSIRVRVTIARYPDVEDEHSVIVKVA